MAEADGAVPGLRVVGLLHGGAEEVFDAPLGHGADPTQLAYDHGYAVLAPVEATRRPGRGLVLTLAVRPLDGEPRPTVRVRGRDAGLRLRKGNRPVVRQRIAAYAVVLSDRGLLATEYSGRTAVVGRWGMPGGGLDPQEEPADAVIREVAEETSQQVELGPLIRVQTSHWVGRSPRRVVEDFHAVRLIYRAACPAPADPVVLDRGGTTSGAAWIALDRWHTVRWTANWQSVLTELLADHARSGEG